MPGLTTGTLGWAGLGLIVGRESALSSQCPSSRLVTHLVKTDERTWANSYISQPEGMEHHSFHQGARDLAASEGGEGQAAGEHNSKHTMTQVEKKHYTVSQWLSWLFEKPQSTVIRSAGSGATMPEFRLWRGCMKWGRLRQGTILTRQCLTGLI